MALKACNISTTACPMRWDDLDEDGPGRRYCRHCDDFVHDVSELTDEEARELLRRGGQRPACLRYEILPDGRVLTKSVSHYGLAVLSVAVLAAGALTGCTEPEEPLDLVEIAKEERPGPTFDELNRNATHLDERGFTLSSSRKANTHRADNRRILQFVGVLGGSFEFDLVSLTPLKTEKIKVQLGDGKVYEVERVVSDDAETSAPTGGSSE